jgi:hypothetical protein
MAGRGQKGIDTERKSAHERREAQLAQIARRQHAVVSRSQLVEIGLMPPTIDGRVMRGRLHRIHNGVYCLLPPPHTVRQRWIAAVLACGPESALCGSSAGVLQDIADGTGLPAQVRSPARSGRGRAGIVVHRGEIDPRDLRIVEGIRCVSADLVLIELAPELGEAELEVVLVAAESKGLLKRSRLGELVGDRHGRPGMPKLERLLTLEPVLVRSGLELLMLPIASLAGVGRPQVNHPITVPGRERPLIVDFAWPGLRMAVEADSQRFHGDWERARADRERDQLLALAGWWCHRFTRDRFRERDWMASRLRELVAVSACA